MTPDQIARVRASWRLVVPVAEIVAARFYEQLFARDPALRSLFAHADLTTQRRKLMQTLAVVVAGIENIDLLLPAVAELGRRHARYGVTDTHYDAVGEVLLRTLALALGDRFDRKTREAWAAAYGLLVDAMKRGAGAIAATAQRP
jgi:nitric oxide dioxygenase